MQFSMRRFKEWLDPPSRMGNIHVDENGVHIELIQQRVVTAKGIGIVCEKSRVTRTVPPGEIRAYKLGLTQEDPIDTAFRELIAALGGE